MGHNAAFELGQDQKGIPFDGKFLHFSAGTPTDTIVGYGTGALAVDTTNGVLYINTNDYTSATWIVVGTQT